MRWHIIVPAWGERCVGHLLASAVPSILAALDGRPAVLYVHTDQRERVAASAREWPLALTTGLVPEGITHYHQFSAAQREVLPFIPVGEPVAFINADHVVSREAFAEAERRFAAGAKLVLCSAIRTLLGDKPPIGASGLQLNEWAWQHRHPWTEDCIWGLGSTSALSLILFKQGPNVVLRGFHLHTFATFETVHGGGFAGLTIDDGLPELYQREELSVVTAHEMAMCEVSPPTVAFDRLKAPFREEQVAKWANLSASDRGGYRASDAHLWLFENHRIAMIGDPQKVDIDWPICDGVVSRIRASRAAA